MSRAPRKPMAPSLSKKDLAMMQETAAQGGLTPVSTGESTGKSAERTPPEPSESQVTPPPAAKGIRPYIAPSTDLALAVQEVISSLSSDAQKFAQPAAILRSFFQEHDAQLAKMFREDGFGK